MINEENGDGLVGENHIEEGVKVLKPWEEVVGNLEDLHRDEDGFHVEIGGVGIYEFMTFEKGYVDFLDAIAKIPKGSQR